MIVTARPFLFVTAAVIAAFGLAACAADTPEPAADSAATPSVVPESPEPGEGQAMPSDGVAPTSDPQPEPTSTITTSTLELLRIDETDYTDFDWIVSCSGLTTSPTVIASAHEDDTEYVVVLIGSGTDSLASFTFTETRSTDGRRDRLGLTVTPGVAQGNGSLTIDGNAVSSNGRGTAYESDTSASDTEAIYSFAVQCAN